MCKYLETEKDNNQKIENKVKVKIRNGEDKLKRTDEAIQNFIDHKTKKNTKR